MNSENKNTTDALPPIENVLEEMIAPEPETPNLPAGQAGAKPETKYMETHAHHLHHAPGKKFWHYFFEFFMLFLAVTLGFIVENLREHYVENQRAKELAKNLYKEIYADSINVRQRTENRELKERECTYFISYVKDSNLTTLSRRFYPAFTSAFIQVQNILFEPNDGNLNQLRNSGSLRYFKSNELQARIGELSVAIANIRTRNDKEYSYVELNLRPFSIRHYDFSWYQAFTQNGRLILMDAQKRGIQLTVAGKLINADKFSRQEAESVASYYLLMLRGTRQVQYAAYTAINHQLLEILRKEYHLE